MSQLCLLVPQPVHMHIPLPPFILRVHLWCLRNEKKLICWTAFAFRFTNDVTLFGRHIKMAKGCVGGGPLSSLPSPEF